MLLQELLLRLLTPFECLGCGNEGSLICPRCAQCHIRPFQGCYACLQPASEGVCRRCRPLSRLSSVHSVTSHDGIARDVIHALKFARAKSGSQLIAQLMHQQLPYYKDFTVVPIPTVSPRVRERGYDQAVLIAQQFAQYRGYWYSSLLSRSRQTRQVGANRATRQHQLEGSLVFARDVRSPPRVLLVDDVITTGATIQHAARTMSLNGAKEVAAIAFAQTL